MIYQKQDIEDQIVLALKKYARSLNSGVDQEFNFHLVIEATSQLPLNNLDYWERFIRWEFSKELSLSKTSKWKFWKHPTPIVNWIDLCSENGFKREKTLQILAGTAAPNRFFFALALRRINDWVVQVREAACKTIPDTAKSTKPEFVVDVLCALIPHLNSWGRVNDAEKQVLLNISSLDKICVSLKEKIKSTPSGPMATILSQIGCIEIFDHYLEELAKNAIQPSVRAKSFRCLLEGQMSWFAGKEWQWTEKPYNIGYFKPIINKRPLSITVPFLHTLKMAAIDRSPIVRRVAGEMLIKHIDRSGDEALYLAKLLSIDPSSSVAERGKYVLQKLGK